MSAKKAKRARQAARLAALKAGAGAPAPAIVDKAPAEPAPPAAPAWPTESQVQAARDKNPEAAAYWDEYGMPRETTFYMAEAGAEFLATVMANGIGTGAFKDAHTGRPLEWADVPEFLRVVGKKDMDRTCRIYDFRPGKEFLANAAKFRAHGSRANAQLWLRFPDK